MQECVECVECGSVTLAGGTGPRPARWEARPGCGAAEFEWTG